MQQKALFTLILLAVATLSFSQSKSSDTTKILFIGNSYTYYNSSPELLKGLAKEKFPNRVVETQLISQGGMTLERHWKGDRALQAIKSNDWDFVVLQEQSKLGMRVIIDNQTHFGQTELFFEYARKFDTEIKKSGAKTVFFMTWSTEGHPEEQEILTHAYTSIAKKLNATLAPVGLAWDKVRNNDQVDLYFVDGSHPSPQGSYLVATTMFATLFGESPVNLSGTILGNRLSSSGVPTDELSLLTEISKKNAKVMQQASWSAVKSLKRKGGYPIVNKPSQNYTIPVLEASEAMDPNSIAGRWYGTSTYSADYNGLIVDIVAQDNEPKVSLSFYTPDRVDQMTILESDLRDNQLHLTTFDSLRSLQTSITLSLKDGQLIGMSESMSGNVTRYKRWNISRNKVHNGLNLETLDKLRQTFKASILKEGYVPASLTYYKQYSRLIGTDYQPEEVYLNTMGAILLQDNKMTDALNLFELAMKLYPQSVNAHLNLGEVLVGVKQYEKGVKVYTAGYELAKKTKHKDLLLIESNLKKLKENASVIQLAPPPPPPPGGH